MDAEAVVDELYGLNPSEFTAARDATAVQARNAGDKELAAAIKKLRRPSPPAWLANVLVRERPQKMGELFVLASQLRDAQRRLAGTELKELARQGHRVVAELVGEAERLAASAGQSPGGSVLRQLQETLGAALADPEAARQVRAGRLTAPLSYAGLGSAGDEPQAVAGDGHVERAAAERAVADLHAAEKRVAELTAELQSAQRRRERIRDQLDDLERQLRHIRSDESEAAREIEQLEAAIAAANEEIGDASRRIRG